MLGADTLVSAGHFCATERSEALPCMHYVTGEAAYNWYRIMLCRLLDVVQTVCMDDACMYLCLCVPVCVCMSVCVCVCMYVYMCAYGI